MRIPWVSAAALLLLLLAGGAADLTRRPYLGFALHDDRVADVDRQSPASHAGLRTGDRVLQAWIPGPDSTSQPRSIRAVDLWRLPRGATVWLIVTDGGPARSVTFPVMQPPAAEAIRRGLNLLTAMTFLAVGLFTWFRRPDALGQSFLLLCLAFAAVFRPPLPPGPGWLTRLGSLLDDVAVLALGVAMVHFVQSLPDDGAPLTGSARRWLRGIDAAAVILMLITTLFTVGPPPPHPVELAVRLAALLLVAGCLIGALIRFVVVLRRTADRSRALRLRIVLWGAFLGLLPMTIGLLLRNLSAVDVPGAPFMALSVWFLPLTWMYAIVRHQIFDIRLVLRRGLVAVVLTTLMAVVYVALVVVIGPRLDPGEGRPVMTFVALLVIALLFTGTRSAIQALVDRLFFRANVSRHQRLDELAGQMASFVDVERLEGLVLDELAARLEAPRAALYEVRDDGRRLVLSRSRPRPGDAGPAGASGADEESGARHPPAALPFPPGLCDLVDRLEGPVTRADLLGAAPADLRSSLAARLGELGFELFIPLKDGSLLQAVAAFDLPRHRGGLDSQEMEILERIARHASEALSQARRREDEMTRERLAGELEVARNIQRHLLPDEPPLSPLVEFAAITRPCDAVGGDCHDFVRLADGRLGLAVADVSGKGVPAAILMASVQASFHAMAESGLGPGELLAGLNRRVLEIDQPDRFVCFFYALIDPVALEVRFANSGLEPPILFRASGGRVTLDQGGLLLGVQPGAAYEEGRLRLESGDVLVCFSDGLVDTAPPAPPPLDIDALEAVVRAHAGESAERMKREILRAARLADGEPPEDDVTVAVVRIY